MGIFRRRHTSTASTIPEDESQYEYQMQKCTRRHFPRLGRRNRREAIAASTISEASEQPEYELEQQPQRPWILWLLAISILWWMIMAIIRTVDGWSGSESAYTIKPGQALLSSIDGRQAHIVSASYGDPCALGKAAGYAICIVNKRSSWWS